MTLTVSSRGQLVLPAAIRKRYKIEPQSQLELVDVGGEMVLVPLPRDAFRGSRGILKGVTTKDLIETRRRERRREHAA